MSIKTYYPLHVRIVKSFFIFFLLVQFCTRLALVIREYENIKEEHFLILYAFLYGAGSDILAFICLLIVIFIFFLFPLKKMLSSGACSIAVLFFLVSCVYFIATAEYFFWAEFHSRFNFIAIDYLIYTGEVIANIRESYPVYIISSAIFIFPLFTTFFLSTSLQKKDSDSILNFNVKALCRWLVLCCLAIFLYVITGQYLCSVNNQYINEIAKNGYNTLFSALKQSEISYEVFYLQEEEKDLLKLLRAEVATSNSSFLDEVIMREIKEEGAEKRYNVMLIAVESLSAEFLSAFGNKENLTPYLNDIAKESVLFTNLYAAGIRTAYGLSAINLSIPPIPGNAIIRRWHNENLISLGYILNNKGYESKFIQGGDSNFDNMYYFFSNNGYEVIDKHNFAGDEVTFSNAWGVCDEDLFNKVIKESNKSHANNKPFFNMIATISNHTPFTYPDNKIEATLGNKRKGAVKYTDYAIKQFIEQAKTQPWFDNTIFIITADHTASSAGKAELDPVKYNIPMIIYAPKIVPTLYSSPKLYYHEVGDSEKQIGWYVDQLIGQLDIAPTILGILNMSYNSTFYGKNALKDDINRSFISNYQKLGYVTDKSLCILSPQKSYSYYEFDQNGVVLRVMKDTTLLKTAICYFQAASKWRKFNSISQKYERKS